MKQPLLLKNILDICFMFLTITLLAGIVAFALSLWGESFIPLELNEQVIDKPTPTAWALLGAELAIGALIVYTVFILRKLIRSFFKMKLFTAYQISTLRRVGQLIITITLLQIIIDLLGGILFSEENRINIGISLSLGSFWFILAVGLFFMYLSKVFEDARQLKEENELTV